MNSKNPIQLLDRAVSLFEHILYVICGIVLFLMVGFVTYGVFGRILFDLKVAWTVELAEYTLVYMTFLSAAWVLKKDGHVQVDVVLSIVNERKKAIMMKISYAIITIGSALFFYYSALVTIDHFQRDVVMYNITQFPKFIVLMPIPIGCLLLVFRGFLKMVEKSGQESKLGGHI